MSDADNDPIRAELARLARLCFHCDKGFTAAPIDNQEFCSVDCWRVAMKRWRAISFARRLRRRAQLPFIDARKLDRGLLVLRGGAGTIVRWLASDWPWPCG